MRRGERNREGKQKRVAASRATRWFAPLRRVIEVGALASTLCVTSLLHAEPALDPASERANNLFKKGKQAYEEGKDQESYRLLREAWALRKSSDIAANLALIETELGKYRDAAEHYSYALKNLLPSSTDAQKQALLKGLEEAKKYITVLRLTAEPQGTEIFVDGTSVGKAPLADDVFVDPGDLTISAKLAEFAPIERRVIAAAGATQVVWLKLDRQSTKTTTAVPAPLPRTQIAPKPTSPSVRQPTHTSNRSIIPAVALSGAAVLAAGAGVVFTLEANSSQTKADDIARYILNNRSSCDPGTSYGAECADLKDANQSVETHRNLATVSFVVAGAAGIGTVVYLLWPESDKGVSAHGMITRDGGELTLRGRF